MNFILHNHNFGTYLVVRPFLSHGLTPTSSDEELHLAFRFIRFGKISSPSPLCSVMYIYSSPKMVTLKTSYPVVAFHPPQVIQTSTSTGSVLQRTLAFNLLMVSSFVFGSNSSFNRLLRLAFTTPTPRWPTCNKLSH